MDRECLNALCERVIGSAFEVSNSPGAGFLERVYERALLRELELLGISAVAQVQLSVLYKGFCVGEYFADVLVEGALIVELKCVERFGNEHTAQGLNYLKVSGMELCLLVNFQRAHVDVKRVVLGY
jgi:GxxExxY protein